MTIKEGDLVMVVGPMRCCGSMNLVGHVFKAEDIEIGDTECASCGSSACVPNALVGINDTACVELYRLKKIDPPADGDSLPTRKDLEMPA